MRNLLIAGFVLAGLTAQAQSAARTTAFMALKDGDLQKAVEFIEPTLSHPKTMEDPKTWFYRGNIYYAIATSEDESVKAMVDNPLKLTFESYKKAKELDTKGRYTEDLEQQIIMTRIAALNGGVAKFQSGDFGLALKKFEIAKSLAEVQGKIDTNAIYNGAIAAERAGNPDRAIELYQSALELDYFLGGDVYAQLIGVYKAKENDEKIAELLAIARPKFPENEPLLFEEANLFFRQQNFEGAQKALLEAVEKVDEDRKVPLMVSIAGIYDKLGQLDKARETYDAILAKDPNNFEANQAIGALIFNEGVEANNVANEISDNKKYAEAMKQVNKIFESSMPFLEKAHSIEPDDVQTLLALKQLYVRLKMNDKYAEIKNKLEALGY
ncbi:MAG: tetratricopeptide repeat protein [Luteibaculaceae bacterium]